MLSTQSYLQSHLRNTEEVVQYCDARISFKDRERDCALAIIHSRVGSHEWALFVFKKSRLLGRVKLWMVYPVTRELQVLPRLRCFLIRWKHDERTDVSIEAPEEGLLEGVIQRVSEMSSYQREPFSTRSQTLRWVWYYESFIPQFIKDTDEQLAESRVSVALKPEHYGKEAMQTYVQQQMQKREAEYSFTHTINCFAGTWNCAGTGPGDSIVPWLRCCGADPDILLLGLQEVCILNAANILGDEARASEWLAFLASQVQEAFPNGEYRLVNYKNLVGLLSAVFVHKNHKKNVVADIAQSVKLGLKGVTVRDMQGNKGAVGTSLKVYNTAMCFINCHLAPFKEGLEDRNEQFHKIVEKLRFQSEVQKGIYEYEIVVWLGDLNYRIDGLSDSDIDRLVSEKRFEDLSNCDQLRRMRETGQAFSDFVEAELTFPPTYKFVIGGSEYNVGQGDPSWCDRIMWRGAVSVGKYRSFMDVSQSDHKPVFLTFSFLAKEIDIDKFLKVKAELYSVIDQQHHSAMPRLKVSTTSVHFADVRYKCAQSTCLALENIGSSSVEFDFQSKSALSTIPSWLKLVPSRGALNPGEALQVQIDVFVNEKHARKVYSNPEYLKKILVLSVQRGSDYFVICTQIEVTCEYLQSVFGSEIEHLRRIRCPVRQLKVPISEAAAQSSTVDPVPKELWRMLEFIEKKGKHSVGLFSMGGLTEEEERIRECLDTGTEFPSGASPQAMSSVLIEFLMVLRSPILLVEWLDLYCLEYIEHGKKQTDLIEKFVRRISEPAANCFIAIVAVLKRLLEFAHSNRLTKERLSQVFLESLTHADQYLAQRKAHDLDLSALYLTRFHRQGFLTLFLR